MYRPHHPERAAAFALSGSSGRPPIAELGGEAKDAGRTIPCVMIVSTFSVGVLYVLIAVVAAVCWAS